MIDNNIISYHTILYHTILNHIILYYIKRTYILLQQEDIFFSHKKTYHVSRPHIQAPNTSSRVHTHPRGSGPQKFKFSTFSQVHPMTFGLCLGIITDTFQRVFKFSKQSFFRNLFFSMFCHIFTQITQISFQISLKTA